MTENTVYKADYMNILADISDIERRCKEFSLLTIPHCMNNFTRTFFECMIGILLKL